MRVAVARAAARRTHVLIVETPGSWVLRARAERAVYERGWVVAESPADADLLLVCGSPGRGLSAAVERIWCQFSGPRERARVMAQEELDPALDEAVRLLVDGERQRSDARRRPKFVVPDESGPEQQAGVAHDHMDMDMDMDMDDGGHDMEMSPSGIPLAEGADEDRDGLEMDALRVRLGPVLTCWPAGLVVHVTLHGDTIVEASVEMLDGAVAGGGDVLAQARRCDRAVGVLRLAGADAAAWRVRRIRDSLLDGDGDDVVAALRREHARLRRLPALRWALRGVGALDSAQVGALGLPGCDIGDTYDRLLALVAGTPGGAPLADNPLPSLAEAVTGMDLGVARLFIASLDLTAVTVAGRAHGLGH